MTASEFDSFKELANKNGDALLTDKKTGLFLIKENNFPIVVSGVPLFFKPYATLVYKGMGQDFIDKYNAALKRIKEDGTFDKIYKRCFKK